MRALWTSGLRAGLVSANLVRTARYQDAEERSPRRNSTSLMAEKRRAEASEPSATADSYSLDSAWAAFGGTADRLRERVGVESVSSGSLVYCIGKRVCSSLECS